MNINQKMILIVGASIVGIALITAPQYQLYNGSHLAANEVSNLANQYDFQAAMIRGGAIAAVTFALYIFFKDGTKTVDE